MAHEGLLLPVLLLLIPSQADASAYSEWCECVAVKACPAYRRAMLRYAPLPPHRRQEATPSATAGTPPHRCLLHQERKGEVTSLTNRRSRTAPARLLKGPGISPKICLGSRDIAGGPTSPLRPGLDPRVTRWGYRGRGRTGRGRAHSAGDERARGGWSDFIFRLARAKAASVSRWAGSSQEESA